MGRPRRAGRRPGFFALHDADTAREIGGANGVTSWQDVTVTVRADMDAAARAKTLCQELGHVRMHDPRGQDGTVDRAAAMAVTRSVKEVEVVVAADGSSMTAIGLPRR